MIAMMSWMSSEEWILNSTTWGVHLVNFVRRTIDPDELNAIASDLGLPQLLEHKD